MRARFSNELVGKQFVKKQQSFADDFLVKRFNYRKLFGRRLGSVRVEMFHRRVSIYEWSIFYV